MWHKQGHIHIQSPTGWGQQSWGLRLWPLLIFITSTGNADFLVQGQFPKWQQGNAAFLKSWDKQAASWFTAWQKNRNETAEFPRESPSQPAALWVKLIQKALELIFFSTLINCPLGQQELDKAQRSWLISSWAGEQRWRQSFLSKAPVVLSPGELQKHLGTLSNFWLQFILFQNVQENPYSLTSLQRKGFSFRKGTEIYELSH